MVDANFLFLQTGIALECFLFLGRCVNSGLIKANKLEFKVK